MNSAIKAFQRTAASPRQTLVLLAPDDSTSRTAYYDQDEDNISRSALLSKMQRFRGATYLKDGAITSHALDSEGRHIVESDWRSWHVLAVDKDGEVCGCSRYTGYRGAFDFESLSVGRSALAQSDTWAPKLRAAIECERRIAWRRDGSFVELGGWAIAENLRGTLETLRVALATFALAECLGLGAGVTTATVRHNSATILRKIGGRPLSFDNLEIPRYFDPQYQCDMEILRFDSDCVNPKFVPMIQQLKSEILTHPALASHLHYSRPRAQESSTEFGMGLQVAYGW